MAEATNSNTSWENPLMPNARLRQIYLAMLQTRIFARSQSKPRHDSGTQGYVACLVSPAIDLGPQDLISDVLSGAAMDFLRGAFPTNTGKPRRRALQAECGSAKRLPVPSNPAERIWAAIGAAAALKAHAPAQNVDVPQGSQSVVAAYAFAGELAAGEWKKAMSFAVAQQLPILFLILPHLRGRASRKPKDGALCQLAIQSALPALPVDADDAVAIYRVAQESVGHARIGGGPALIECIAFAPQPGKKTSPDAIATLERYILERGIAAKAWMDREAKSFARRAAPRPAASK